MCGLRQQILRVALASIQNALSRIERHATAARSWINLFAHVIQECRKIEGPHQTVVTLSRF
jgi:hypothetical protein